MTDLIDERGDDAILEHYEGQARLHGLSSSSTMADEVTRTAETQAVLACLSHVVDGARSLRVLEIGCGNGHLLQTVAGHFPGLRLTGVDYSRDMVELARTRNISGCEVHHGDVRSLGFPAGSFDVVVSERCVINVLDADDQAGAFEEIHRVLVPGGHLVLIEAFTDGASNLNRAREEMGLPPNAVPHHNRWLDKQTFLSFVEERYTDITAEAADGVPPRNFLSSHYFVSRVLYPAVTRREVLYNTEFVKFFQFLPPMGEYSPIQLFFLRKLDAAGP